QSMGTSVNYQVQINDNKKLLETLMENPELFTENIIFNISSQIFVFIKQLSKVEYNLPCRGEIERIFRSYEIITGELYKKNESLIWNREMFLFFNSLIKDVEINFKDDSGAGLNEGEFFKYEEFFHPLEEGDEDIFESLKNKF